MVDGFQYWILTKVAPPKPPTNNATYSGTSKVRTCLGDEALAQMQDKTVIDFGCGEGECAVDLARFGVRKVIGIDIREDVLATASARAAAAGVSDRCEFTMKPDTKADVIISIDAFEHFADPEGVLETISGLLKPDGHLLLSFGPTWYHPLGGHLFSVFPWAHLVFSEDALCRWRSTVRSDGAKKFSEVAGGLNQMTISRFERLVAASKLKLESMETVPIRPLRRVHAHLTREFTTSMVRATLGPKH